MYVTGTVFGELWKLEPLPEERKSKWRREMDWLLSPTNYMVELVPAKQNGANGRMLEVLFSLFKHWSLYKRLFQQELSLNKYT